VVDMSALAACTCLGLRSSVEELIVDSPGCSFVVEGALVVPDIHNCYRNPAKDPADNSGSSQRLVLEDATCCRQLQEVVDPNKDDLGRLAGGDMSVSTYGRKRIAIDGEAGGLNDEVQ
jgi:hypothetical protein